MSNNEYSDDLEDLQELAEEYRVKETAPERTEVCSPKRSSEVPMEKIIFGNKNVLLKNMAKAIGENISEEYPETVKPEKGKKRKPVWIDNDDEDIHVGDIAYKTKRGNRDHLHKDKSYKEHLTKRFDRFIGAQPKWAEIDRETDVNSDDELLQTVGFLEKPSGSVLLPNILDFKTLVPLNKTTKKSEGPIVSIQFHPTSTAALVAGRYGYATVYAIDGRKNEKLHNIHFDDFPLKCVRITPCGTKAIFGSIKSYYFSYDLMAATETRFFLPRIVGPPTKFNLSPCGRYMAMAGRGGELHLFDANANELIYTFKQENDVADLCFTGDSKRIICTSKGANASIFSLQMRRIEHSFFDEGCVTGNVLNLSPNQRLIATGSKEGAVNVYDFNHVLTTKTPTPMKTLLNLTTEISDIKFNHSSELLAMCSSEVNNSVRLVHFPSGTVYSNFPRPNPELGPIGTMEFSPGSGYLAMGSFNKTAHLYRLKHFNNY